MMAAKVTPPKHMGVTIGAISDEEGARAWWFCDDIQGCGFFFQLDLPTLVEKRGREAMIDDVFNAQAPCPHCGGIGHVVVTRKPDPVKEQRAGAWLLAGLIVGAAFMFFGAFFNFEQMTSGQRFRPFQLIICIPTGLALIYFAWEVWKGMRSDGGKA